MATNACVSSGFYGYESQLENDPPSPNLKSVMHISRLEYVDLSTMSKTLPAVIA